MVEAHKGKQMNMYGTRHTFLLNPEEVYTKFPHAPKDLKIKVVLTGHFSKPEIQKILKPYLTTRRHIERLKQQFDIWGNEYWLEKNLDREQLSHYDDVQKQIDVILVTSGFNEKDKKKIKKIIALDKKRKAGINLLHQEKIDLSDMMLHTGTVE